MNSWFLTPFKYVFFLLSLSNNWLIGALQVGSYDLLIYPWKREHYYERGDIINLTEKKRIIKKQLYAGKLHNLGEAENSKKDINY